MELHAQIWKESPNIAKWRRKQGVNRQYTGDFGAIFFITRYGINTYLCSGFYGPGAVLGIFNNGSGLRPSGFIWQVTSARLAGDVIHIWINSSSSNHCTSHFKAQLAQLVWHNLFIVLLCFIYIVVSHNMIILYFRLPCFHVSNSTSFLHSTLVLSFYIDVFLTLSTTD